MIDLHCHILPGMDDGPATLEQSLEMARFCVADGIDCITATPHCHKFVHLLRAEILPRVEQLNRDLKAADVPLTILPGSEIQVTDAADFKREFEAGVFCHLGGKKHFTLIEFNWERGLFPADSRELIEWIQAKGTQVILAHPERHDFFKYDPALLEAMVEAGAWVQITVDSLLGNHGPMPKELGERFLKQYPNAVLATDAHRMGRCSGLSAGYAWVRENLGAAREADLLARSELVRSKIMA